MAESSAAVLSRASAPEDEEELAAVVADAVARRTPLAISGGNTRAGLGRPVEAKAELSTAGMTGITLYEPAELVISARAGTPVAEVEAELRKRGQQLPFEPFDHRPLYATTGEPTVGGLVATNASGPRRIQAGAARDSLIGVRAVTGKGETIKSGGRVMKNVTGYDLVKLLAGSHGTLAVLTEVTFKVLPTAETEASLVFFGLADEAAIAALSAALGSPFSVTGAAHCLALAGERPLTAIRLDGFAVSVADRAGRLRDSLAEFGKAAILDAAATRALWHDIATLRRLAAAPDTPLWRISARPSDSPQLAAAIRRQLACEVLYDWGGGLLWVAGGTGEDAGAAAVRAAVAGFAGAHGTLVRATADVRARVPVFQPLAPPLMALTKKLKDHFDPAGILNPGRMYAGI